MATDWAADVKKYAPNADDGVIAGIVRYCGIALRKVNSSLVAFSDKKETDRVRENFLKKKLALTNADSVLDAAIAKVGETMKADRTKNRVTVYYLLADNFNKLGLFAPKTKTAAKAPAKKPAGKAAGAAALAGAAGLAAAKAPVKKKAAPAKKAAVVATTKKAPTKKVAIKAATAPQPLMDKTAGAGNAAVAGTVAAAGAVAAATASVAASEPVAKVVEVASAAPAAAVSRVSASSDDDDSGLGWLWWLLLALLAAFLVWWLFLRGSGNEAAAPAAAPTEVVAPAAASADLTAAPAEGTVEIPAGAGVTSEMRDGKPVVKVYFDTGRADVVPDFTGAAGGLKAWLDSNPGSSLEVSGFNDPTGNAAANARLSKRRAEAVGAALVASGVPQTAMALVKPEASTDSTTNLAGARRVEVTVK